MGDPRAQPRTGDDRPAPGQSLVRVTVEHEGWRAAVDAIDELAGRAVDAARCHCRLDEPVEVSVLLCGDHTIRQLNRRYRGQDRPTDTLSFPADAPRGVRPRPLGDIVVAFETATADATRLATPIDRHLTHLIVHGCLHLLGYDHVDDSEATAMEHLEARILASLGIDDPYALR